MKIRQLTIKLQTSDGPYGTTITFPDGLVIVWADNSMGKSSCVKALLVALGMEATLTTSQSELPLTPAITNRLEGENGEILVQESDVFLEIENKQGNRIVIHRTIKGTRDDKLVTVHDGPALTQPQQHYPSSDYFVNRPGGASREHGFHRFLEQFAGWELPLVPSYDGKEIALYLQCIVPYFIVEQTRGWSTIQPPLPTQFRIKEPAKRAVEFLLNLDAHRVALKRQELLQERVNLESEWREHRAEISEVVRRLAGEIQNLPVRPVGDWPPQIPPRVIVASNEQWVSIDQRILELKATLAQLEQQIIPQVQEVTTVTAHELQAAEFDLRRREVILSRLIASLEMERAEVVSVKKRVDVIEEDIQRNQDIETLRRLGSTNLVTVESGECPFCHQAIVDSLLPVQVEQKVMSVQENIEFLKEQRKTFQLVQVNAERVVNGRQLQIQAAHEEVNQLRERIRALRQTLIADGRIPSIAAIRERLQLEDQIREATEAVEAVGRYLGMLGEVAERWHTNLTEMGKLPPDDTTAEDKGKLATWTKVLREQLQAYGFRSLPIQQILISDDTYRPEHGGFDLQVNLFDEQRAALEASLDLQTSISASDMIRTIWSYLEGMMEVSRQVATNHPGFIVFDEPRQQSTKNISFEAFLKRASQAKSFGQQIILFTSEDRVRLRDNLSGLDHTLIEIEGRLIKKAGASQQ